jgi:hypothetical protein
MRFHVAGTARAKALPKALSRTVSLMTGSKPSLSHCQAAVAQALGYASFAELLRVAGGGHMPPSPLDDAIPAHERTERIQRQAAAFSARLGLGDALALDIAREAALTGRPGRGTPSDAPVPASVSTLGWPIRYEGAIRDLDAEALRSFDTIIETIPPGRSSTGLPGLVPHLVTGEAVDGKEPYIRVRYATMEEVLATFPREAWDDGEEDDEADDDEDRDTLARFCHPSERHEDEP